MESHFTLTASIYVVWFSFCGLLRPQLTTQMQKSGQNWTFYGVFLRCKIAKIAKNSTWNRPYRPAGVAGAEIFGPKGVLPTSPNVPEKILEFGIFMFRWHTVLSTRLILLKILCYSWIFEFCWYLSVFADYWYTRLQILELNFPSFLCAWMLLIS